MSAEVCYAKSMRRTACRWLMTAALGLLGCSSSAPRPLPQSPQGIVDDSGPPWLPAYSPAQLELLRPIDAPIPVPATRTFPDVRKFAYDYVGGEPTEPLTGPSRPYKLVSLVKAVLEKSPKFYVLKDMRPELENVIALYGPAALEEADPWEQIRANAIGRPYRYVLPEDDPARAALADAIAKRDRGRVDEAIEAMRVLFGVTRVGAVGSALAETLKKKGDEEGANDVYRQMVLIDPASTDGRLGLAAMHEKAGRRKAARHEIAEALAYWPASRKAALAADRLTEGFASQNPRRPQRFRIFLDVDVLGAVHVGYVGDSEPARIYAGCKAIVRYEEGVRAELFHRGPKHPYYLSIGEEAACYEAAIGAYISERVRDGKRAVNPELDALIALAREDGLVSFVMVEVLGRYRPEKAREALPELHDAMVKYVERVVLDGALVEDPERGMFMAQR